MVQIALATFIEIGRSYARIGKPPKIQLKTHPYLTSPIDHSPHASQYAILILNTKTMIPILWFDIAAVTLFFLVRLALTPVIYIHAVVPPRKGINGWAGEPKGKYYDLRGWEQRYF